ncbi:MAG: NAD-dependent epimerase/dehydratase family protein [Novosphingobium sp.]
MNPELAGRRVVVTGASGFIGGAAVRALIAAGAQVTALTRSRDGARRFAAEGAKPVVTPLEPGARLDRALAGAEVLVHLAYDMRAGAEPNLAAFAAVLDVARRAGIGHIVHVSSVVVYDAWPKGRIDEESSVGTRPAQGYRAAKIAMEEQLLAGPLAATILQPTIVWGPGSALWTERPMRQLRAGGLVLPDPWGRAPLVHVEDVARAIVAATALPAPGRARVLISGPDTPGWNTLFEAYRTIVGGTLIREPAEFLCAALGPEARTSPAGPSATARVSAALRRVLGHHRFEQLLERAARLRPAPPPARPAAADLALFTASPLIDTSRAEALLGHVSLIGFEDGLAMLRAHYASLAGR